MKAARGQAAGSGGLLAAFGLFTVLPVPGRAATPGPGVLRWLPVVGLVLGGLACLPALAVWRGEEQGAPFLASAVVVTGLALLTRGLHLDGTADLADGLGSGRPAEQALAIMRRPDVGAFGVVALVCVLLLQVTALGTVLAASSVAGGVLAVVLSTATGRVAVVHAASRPPAAGSSLGVLVAGAGAPGLRWGAGTFLLAAAAGVGAVTGGSAGHAVWWSAAVVLALLVAALLTRHAARRLGGVNGDVFGAVVETGTTVALVVLAAMVTWT